MKRLFTRPIKSALQLLGLRLVRASADDALRESLRWRPSHRDSPISSTDAQYLRSDNPRLVELRKAYAGHVIGPAALWSDDRLSSTTRIRHFRGDNSYVWQVAGDKIVHGLNPEVVFGLSGYYALRRDRLQLFDLLKEDGAFGCHVYSLENAYTISRDLIDSILEINYLAEILGVEFVSNSVLVDIGAGYGRLAHRWLTAFESSRVMLFDAVPLSTFLSEFYMKHRGLASRSDVVELPSAETALETGDAKIAANIHSFTECTIDSVRWWLHRIAASSIEYLFIVSNGGLVATDQTSYERDIAEAGFRLVDRRPKYPVVPLDKYGLGFANYFLFGRK